MIEGELNVPILTAPLEDVRDLLLQLPFPAPLSHSTKDQNLLSHFKNYKELRNNVNLQTSIITPHLIEALELKNADNIEMKDEYCDKGIHSENISQLLKCLLDKKPDIFNVSVYDSPESINNSDGHNLEPGFTTQSLNESRLEQNETVTGLESLQSSSNVTLTSVISYAEPKVVLIKLSLKEIRLAQKSVIQFMSYNKKAESSTEFPKQMLSNQCQSVSKTHHTFKNPTYHRKRRKSKSFSFIPPLNRNNDAGLSSSSSALSIPQHTNSSDLDFRSNSPVNSACSSQNRNLETSLSENNPEIEMNNIQTPIYDSIVEPLVANASKLNKEDSLFKSAHKKQNVEDQCLSKYNLKQLIIKLTPLSPSLEVPCKISNDRKSPRRKDLSCCKSPDPARSKATKRKRNASYEKINNTISTDKINNITSRDRKRKRLRIVKDPNFVETSNDAVDEVSAETYNKDLYAEKYSCQTCRKVLDAGTEECQSCRKTTDTETADTETVITCLTKAKFKNKRRANERVNASVSLEDLKESNSYRNFSRTIDTIFDIMEITGSLSENDEDMECVDECPISFRLMQKVSSEAAKVKRLSATNLFPPGRLVYLLKILKRSIVEGTTLLPIQIMEEEQDEEEAYLKLQLMIERIMKSAEASLTALYIMTSPNMPLNVFIEDVIEMIVFYLKNQIENTVYPVYDPEYRPDAKLNGNNGDYIIQKRDHKIKKAAIVQLYNKLYEGISLLAELLESQHLTDTVILQMSTMSVSTFFVEGIKELQLSSLCLMTTIFSQYHKLRQVILTDILTSVTRLPTSNKNLRTYRLNSVGNIQMFSALILQLIHSTTRLSDTQIEAPKLVENRKKTYFNDDDVLMNSYEASVETALIFFSVFFKKYGTKQEETDCRLLLGNFVEDLLSTLNMPEWPASELLLSILGRILIQNLNSKSSDMPLRVVSIDILGLMAARLRKNSVSSEDVKDMINHLIQRIITDCDNEVDATAGETNCRSLKCNETQILQDCLLQYLDLHIGKDPTIQFSRNFYIAQLYRDIENNLKRSNESVNTSNEEVSTSAITLSNSEADPAITNCPCLSHAKYEKNKTKDQSKLGNDGISFQSLPLAEERKHYLLSVFKGQGLLQFNSKNEDHIDHKTAELISRYLASTRCFYKSFDAYLSQILCALNDTTVAVRIKAMKCLKLIVEADPNILSHHDVQKCVYGRLLDHSISVRETAVDLLGKFIFVRPELLSQYYEMLTARILDTGLSVRKRVIKILKEICLKQPDFPQTPDICLKIMKRINDEDSIRNLVREVFQDMWFNPVSDEMKDPILQKVKNLTYVVEASRDTGLEWFEQLLRSLLKNNDDNNYKSVVKSSKQIVDCLIENLLQVEESLKNADYKVCSRLLSYLATIHLFTKIHPEIVVPHATTIQSYLTMKCNAQSDILLLKYIAKTLELVVPLVEHPSDSFLAQIEEDLIKLILRQHMLLLPSCISCLGAVVNKVTHNYDFVKDCFKKYFLVLLKFKEDYEMHPENEVLKIKKAKLLRCLYTVGLFCCHFDFDSIDTNVEEKSLNSIKDRVFKAVMYFTKHDDEDIKLKALAGLGFIMTRHYHFMLRPEIKGLYHNLLTSLEVSFVMKCQVLKNIANYLVREELCMIQKEAEWSKTSKSQHLKEMEDVLSGMASTVIQVYLKQILECVFHAEIAVRRSSLSVIQLIYDQGLVHPVQIVPYLICLSSDDNFVVQMKADQILQDIKKKDHLFIQMKAVLGFRMSYKMHQIIHNENEIIRGFKCSEAPVSRNGILYSLIRLNKQSRRAFLLSLLKLFDEQARTSLTELLYIADNVAYFPYMVQDEPLYIMHQMDVMISVSRGNLLQTFQEALLPKQLVNSTPDNPEVVDCGEDDDDFDILLQRLPEDTTVLRECIIAFKTCLLLLHAKQTLKDLYSFTDNKMEQYSPNETSKIYEKPLNKETHGGFNPETFIEPEELVSDLDDKDRESLVEQYIHFKQLMLKIDPLDDNDHEDIDHDNSNQVSSSPSKTISIISTDTNSTEYSVASACGENSILAKPRMTKRADVISEKSTSPVRRRSIRNSPRRQKKSPRKK